MLTKALDILPHSPQLRRVIASMCFLQGVGYWAVYFLQVPLTTSFARQAKIMPIWAWAIILTGIGLLMFFTATQRLRRSGVGRTIAVLCAGFAAWQLGTFLQVGAYTAIGQFVIIVAVFMGEAMFVSRRGEV